MIQSEFLNTDMSKLCFDYEASMQRSGRTHFDDESTGKVEQCDHPAPVEFSIRKDLEGNFQKHIFCGTERRVVHHSEENHILVIKDRLLILVKHMKSDGAAHL